VVEKTKEREPNLFKIKIRYSQQANLLIESLENWDKSTVFAHANDHHAAPPDTHATALYRIVLNSSASLNAAQ
jgi:hypothetical protein